MRYRYPPPAMMIPVIIPSAGAAVVGVPKKLPGMMFWICGELGRAIIV